MTKGRALFLVPEAPYPTHGGGAMRSASVLEYLAQRYDVDVIVFREPGSPDPALLFPAAACPREILVLDLPRHRKDPISRAVRNAERMARAVPPLVDRFRGFAAPISAFLKGRRYDVAVIEHFWCAAYIEQIAPVSRKTVLNLHNIESVLHQRCATTENGAQAFAHHIFARAARDLEAHWLPLYNQVLTASAEDEIIARAIAPGVDTSVYPNAIPFVPRPAGAEWEAVAFSGNLAYHPNIAAVRYFRREIWPAVREEWPALVWRLIGKNPSAVRRELNGDPRIEFSGPVANAVEQLAAAKVVIIPLLAGSGTRFKLLEAWAAGRAVVSTTIGAEGLPARHEENLLVADDAETFAEAVSRLLTNSGLRARLGETGRALFESEFTWAKAWQKLDL
ncbi:MAG TPA: glycosyltransferase family 4 protein [Bryobacteraceae bacterium]|nr:glycosyltransferase family 4 protein [Bryobacteraceae bacterium]